MHRSHTHFHPRESPTNTHGARCGHMHVWARGVNVSMHATLALTLKDGEILLGHRRGAASLQRVAERLRHCRRGCGALPQIDDLLCRRRVLALVRRAATPRRRAQPAAEPRVLLCGRVEAGRGEGLDQRVGSVGSAAGGRPQARREGGGGAPPPPPREPGRRPERRSTSVGAAHRRLRRWRAAGGREGGRAAAHLATSRREWSRPRRRHRRPYGQG